MRKNVTIEEYEQWWLKWHRKLIVGAAVGIVLDVIVLYVLFSSQFTGNFFFRYIIDALIGVLIGFSVILFFAFNPKLRTKLVKYAINYSNNS